MLKIVVQLLQKPCFTIEISKDLTLEQLTQVLVSQYGFSPDSDYKFICNGLILKDPNPLSNIQENSRIVVYEKKRQIEEEKIPNAQQPIISTEVKEETPNSQPIILTEIKEDAPMLPEIQTHQEENEIVENPQEQNEQNIENLRQLIDIFDDNYGRLHLDALYDKDLNCFAQHKEIQRISEFIDINPALLSVVRKKAEKSYKNGFDNNLLNLENAFFLAGISPFLFQETIDDDDASIELLTNEERKDFDTLMRQGKSRHDALKKVLKKKE
ncbi:hypothetical protein GPJ56_000705 [Histomonas meleagridis]|uniref:uncharacterized protein n=1 Tax=Histomonas meleagridis TaxID=135588 RepID=UPI0035597A8E|nr:hypothetical protein GPJ56_000705 [Histomonas meleagridis]KAH0804536.1 hypothetical protein GO595_003366 [Histomonas meleagridis]